jgi:HlyD family secretion protein
VRVRVNQADINGLRTGQAIRIGLDAYPDLTFNGRVTQLSPLAVTSTLSPKVRYFVMLAEVEGSHERLMPDLTASLDVEIEKISRALVIPRDAVLYDESTASVRVRNGGEFAARPVSLGAFSATEVVVTGGLEAGAVIERHIASTRAQR